MTRVLIMGAPGSGKGTQAVHIAQRHGVPAVSTGDLFRSNLASRTPLGIMAQRYLDAGEYVPDEVTNTMVAERMAAPDAVGGFVLDGYPRTLNQVDQLDHMLAGSSTSLDAVVSLTVDGEELVRRLLERAQTGGRADDTESVIRQRQRLYDEETAPLLNLYGQRGLLIPIDGTGQIEVVRQRLLGALAHHSEQVAVAAPSFIANPKRTRNR